MASLAERGGVAGTSGRPAARSVGIAALAAAAAFAGAFAIARGAGPTTGTHPAPVLGASHARGATDHLTRHGSFPRLRTGGASSSILRKLPASSTPTQQELATPAVGNGGGGRPVFGSSPRRAGSTGQSTGATGQSNDNGTSTGTPQQDSSTGDATGSTSTQPQQRGTIGSTP